MAVVGDNLQNEDFLTAAAEFDFDGLFSELLFFELVLRGCFHDLRGWGSLLLTRNEASKLFSSYRWTTTVFTWGAF